MPPQSAQYEPRLSGYALEKLGEALSILITHQGEIRVRLLAVRRPRVRDKQDATAR